MMQVSRRHILFLNITVAILLASVAVGLVCVPVARIDQSACTQIRPGMTVEDAEEIIGGKPGWYDGVISIRTASPGYKGYKPLWIGSQGEIILDLDKRGRVAAANFYPGRVIDQSSARMVCERLTRNAFGTARSDLAIQAVVSLFAGFIVTGSLVVIVFLWRHHGSVQWPYFVCLLGAIASLALLILAIGVVWNVPPTDASLPFQLLGASAGSLPCFVVGSVLTEKRQHA